jgi:hypothetical protein
MKKRILIPLMAGLALLCACKGKNNTGGSADTTGIVTEKTKNINHIGDTIQSHPKLVKTADIRFQVKDVRQTAEQITALTSSNNGTVVRHWMNSFSGDSTDIRRSDDSLMRVSVIDVSAEMTVKIPPANMENFMNQVARLGISVKNLKMDISDKTLDYLSTRLKLKNQNELVKGQKEVGSDKKNPDDLLAFKNNMVDKKISDLKIDDSVKNSIVILSFYQDNIISKKIIANSDLSTYNLPLLKRLGMSLENGWRVFVEAVVAIANFWVVIPFCVGIWVGIRYYHRKKALELPKTGQV